AQLLVQTNKVHSLERARVEACDMLDSGAPLGKWNEMLVAQGADYNAYCQKLARDVHAPVVADLVADRSGIVLSCDARVLGEVVRDLGGGRLTKDTKINFDVGIDQIARRGESIERSAVLARVHATDQRLADRALTHLREAFVLG
ncbi:MAG: hypothetical protein ACK4UN_20455, partial [Limisphaerales bacterium]